MNHFAKRRISHAKSGARGGKRNGKFFRSTWEFNVSLWLDELVRRGQVTEWSYETQEFEFKGIKRGTRFYKPDFTVIEPNRLYYIEVKGYLDSKSVTALSRMAKYYPEVTILILDKPRYAELESEFGNLEGWER